MRERVERRGGCLATVVDDRVESRCGRTAVLESELCESSYVRRPELRGRSVVVGMNRIQFGDRAGPVTATKRQRRENHGAMEPRCECGRRKAARELVEDLGRPAIR